MIIIASVATPRPFAGLLRLALRAMACLAGGAALLAGIVGAYLLKIRLGIDVVPDVDMLPDERIMAALHAAAELAGL